MEPSFASEWLVPRLDLFLKRHPDIDLSVDADLRLVEFSSHEAEIAIRFGVVARAWPRTEARHLFDLSLTPVLTPTLLAAGPPLASPVDLLHYTLLHDFDRNAWAKWFRAAGLDELASQRGPIYADAAHGMQAARLGHGVALGDPVLEGNDLRLGQLVRPFDIDVPYGAYWLVAPEFKRLSRPARAFAEWIVEELAAGK